MRKYSAAVTATALTVLSSCNTSVTVVAAQPKLVKVAFAGQRVCGNFQTSFQQFSFTCPALPTLDSSGWQITPLVTPSISHPPFEHINNQVNLTITGPSFSSLDIEIAYITSKPNDSLTQVDSTVPNKPGEVFYTREVGVSQTDDGTTRTWTVEVNVSTCSEIREVQFFDRGTSGPRSNPLSVYLLRSPQETYCDPGAQAGPALGGGPGPGDPMNTPASGGCQNGAAQQTFNVCENCAVGHPQQMSVFATTTACSWSDVLKTFGYAPNSSKPQTCTITQADRATCQGPP
jgi:hypothetical protein